MKNYKTIDELTDAYVRRQITQREFIEKQKDLNIIRIPFSRLKRHNTSPTQRKYSGKY